METGHLRRLSEPVAACRKDIVCFDSVESHELKQRKDDREKRLHVKKRDNRKENAEKCESRDCIYDDFLTPKRPVSLSGAPGVRGDKRPGFAIGSHLQTLI